MRKRLRKKKHLGEFQQLGFEISFRYEAASIEAENALLFAFLDEAIEADGLQFGGGGDGDGWSGFAAPDTRYGSATDEQRARVGAWLEARPEVGRVVVGPLRDAWYGW